MPRRRTYGGKRRRKPKTRYYLMPVAAMMIFLVCLALYRTGLARRLEEAVVSAAQNDTLSQTLMHLVLPEGQAAGDAPPLSEVGEKATEPVTESPTDPPFDPGEPDDRVPTVLTLPDAMVFESVMPELSDNPYTPKEDISSITIDGKSGEYEGSGTVYIRNETDLAVDASALLRQKNPVKLSGDGVQVLIMHTHGTEAYTPDSTHPYTPTDTDRTTDSTRNMLRVGDEVAAILEENGIKVIHSATLNDYPAYNGSYGRALEDISMYIKENPSIKVVIDLHRDAMVSQNGTKYKTVASIEGKDAAQLMFVAGTNQGGLVHDSWEKNLTFQLQLQDRMNTLYPGIMRPLVVRSGRYNQHVTNGSMLLEVGTSGNSLSEALYSARLFAEALADMLNGK